jgi:2-keto-4-pentenoate hydratase
MMLVMGVDPRLIAAMREQLSRRPSQAERVGWKYGSGEDEQIGGDHVVGNITSATLLADGDTYRGGGTKLQADVEVAIEVGDDLAPARYGVALEICDLAHDGTIEQVVIDNDYHRGVAFGPFSDELPARPEGALLVNGEQRAAGRASDEIAERVDAVDRVLRAVGEELRPGDRIITGLIVNTRVVSGDSVEAKLDSIGSVALRIA